MPPGLTFAVETLGVSPDSHVVLYVIFSCGSVPSSTWLFMKLRYSWSVFVPPGFVYVQGMDLTCLTLTTVLINGSTGLWA